MKSRRSLWSILALLLFLPGLVFGQAKVGTSTFQFLKIGPSARAVGMGESFIGVSNDASALYYNPGAMIIMKKPNFILSHVAYPAGVKFDYLGGVYPLPRLDGIAGAFISGLTTDDITETTPEMPYGTGRTFNVTETAMGIAYCQRLTDKFSVGLTARYISSDLADVNATGWSADVGTYYETGWRNIRIAMVIQNFGPDVSYIKADHTLPITFKFGGAAEVYKKGDHSVLVSLEGWHPNDNMEMVTVGAEYDFRNFVQFRLGKKVNGARRDSWEEYQNNRTSKDPYVEYPLIGENGGFSLDGASVGFGVKLPMGLGVDYSLSNIGHNFGELHRFTLNYAMK